MHVKNVLRLHYDRFLLSIILYPNILITKRGLIRERLELLSEKIEKKNSFKSKILSQNKLPKLTETFA